MAAINGANLGLGLVTMGLETDFPEDARNTDPGVGKVSNGTTYKIRNADLTGTMNPKVILPVVTTMTLRTIDGAVQ